MCKLFSFYHVLLCVTFILVYGMSVALPFASYFKIKQVSGKKPLTVESGLEDGRSLANHGSNSLGSWTNFAVVVALTARAVRRCPITGQTERHPL